MSRHNLTYTPYIAMAFNMVSLAATILGGIYGWHATFFLVALFGSICITSVSPTHALGQVAACVATLLIWSQFLYRLRAYLAPPPSRPQRRIRLLRCPSLRPKRCRLPTTSSNGLLSATIARAGPPPQLFRPVRKKALMA